VYRWLVPHVVLPLADRLSGRRVGREIRRLRALQWESREQHSERAISQLRHLLAHASVHVPYYRDVMRASGVSPDDVQSLGDLSRLPITTKTELRDQPADRLMADNVPARRRQPMKTSGSTGLPLEFFWDRRNRDRYLASYLLSLEWAGTALWDTRITVAVPTYFSTNVEATSPLVRLARRLALGERTIALAADRVTASAIRAAIVGLGPRSRYFVRGYPAALARVSAELLDESWSLPQPPRAVITYSETLTEHDAASIRRAFGCPVVNYYTSWEIPQIAQTCPDRPDLLHINGDRVVLRVIRPDGTDAAPGEPGRVVVTDLTNEAMPFVNYELGDRAVAGPACPCGRGWPTLLRVEGRDTERIRTLDGRHIHSGTLGHFLTFEAGVLPHVREYQALQLRFDHIVLRVVSTPSCTVEATRALRERLESFLGPGMSVAVERVNRIPTEPSGKRLIIKSIVDEPATRA